MARNKHFQVSYNDVRFLVLAFAFITKGINEIDRRVGVSVLADFRVQIKSLSSMKELLKDENSLSLYEVKITT